MHIIPIAFILNFCFGDAEKLEAAGLLLFFWSVCTVI